MTTTIGNSRKAAFYDRHLAKKLILNRVVYLDSLIASLASTVDQAIQDAFDKGITLPAKKGGLTTQEKIEDDTTISDGVVYREKGIADNYKSFAASYCLPIASTLALHPSHSAWTSLLTWTTDGKIGRWAIADGVLRLKHNFGEDSAPLKAVWDSVGHHDQEKKILVEKLGSVELATWEMKSLNVGPAVVMEEILKMGQGLARFNWKKCNTRPCNHRYIDDMEEAWPEYDRGVDALSPPWTLPADNSSDAVDSPPNSQLSDLRSASARTLARGDVAGPSQPRRSLCVESSSSSLGDEDGSVSVGQRRERSATDHSEEESGSPLAKRQKTLSTMKQSMDDPDPDSEPGLGERRQVNAQSFLQQVHKQCFVL
jgi:hypothetical protein